MRFWCSWEQGGDDYRPLAYPPNEGVLGWWCSGYNSRDEATICAVVEAKNEADAVAVVQKDWPEFDGWWRFIEECEPGWKPNDRFPLSEWMQERMDR